MYVSFTKICFKLFLKVGKSFKNKCWNSKNIVSNCYSKCIPCDRKESVERDNTRREEGPPGAERWPRWAQATRHHRSDG